MSQYNDRILAVGGTLGTAIKEYNKLMAELKAMPRRSSQEQQELCAIENKARDAEEVASGDFSSDDDNERQEQAVAKLELASEIINEAIGELKRVLAKRR